ncbi:MAG: phosphatidylserine decarboxylase family protein [Candidatus Latescibacterota bacterium]|nr:phosphatidylserine decarboxylase family protein [Candidatus Latescibacterota bacterium]
MAKEGFPFVAGALALAVVAWLAAESISWLRFGGALFALLAAFMVFFFRDPRREAPQEEGAIVSAADGKVVAIEEEEEEDYIGKTATRISVFLSVLNVHVNRIPFAGEIDFVQHRLGHHRVAFAEEASCTNEQSVIGIRSSAGKIVVKQIVGILARRIACYLEPGQRVKLGERFGLIRFGSRVDLILPKTAEIRVSVGDRVRAGETVMGVLS